MSVSTAHSTAAEVVGAFTGADRDRLVPEFHRLVAALWDDGTLTDLAVPAVPVLVERLGQVDDERKGYIAVLLGILIEAEYPDTEGPITTAARQGVDLYLDLWRTAPNGQSLSVALTYLVAHFPSHRDRVLAAADHRDLHIEDYTRLERGLQELDPAKPVLGRVFPSPAVWALMDDNEKSFDQTWIRQMTAEQIAANWEKDTRTVWGHAGAKAYWAVVNGTPAPVVLGTVPPRDQVPQLREQSADIFAPHAEALRCPNCGGGIEVTGETVRCVSCSTAFPAAHGILNLSEGAQNNPGDFLYKLAELPSMGLFYEAYARPNFLRIAGTNWGAQVTPEDERRYIIDHVAPVEGPVLDLACGAGTWTEMLVEAVGAERIIALDAYAPMLTATRNKLPELPAVMASAKALPFQDASVGAVLCWNALQAFPDDAAEAIAEVGRILRPGGTFSLLTFRMHDDRLARYFQASHYFPGHQEGMQLFELDDVKRWLADAGLTIRDESGPGTFIIITAERPR
ncbi:hypothetical protein Ssi03_61260 [Sphaerisporangium siamense]|uniref:SAM-dependent methyltransferase n=1 Tax=Sphaerisporangium siamense TaxID=795645 RepID=A0A7W7DBB2_9ACTN|nr:class I SAM-dependent methyltransferase [Sphaerisporangium siamense]MBB4702441.1 SAM-dependent methyltransferase [Sphaerisporangium siamense]GII88136.1 hypothetical protein Ssi03_61260 [Sphaerisporangium siamense]